MVSEQRQYKIEYEVGRPCPYRVYKRVPGFLGFMKWKQIDFDVSHEMAVAHIERDIEHNRIPGGYPKFYSSEDFQ